MPDPPPLPDPPLTLVERVDALEAYVARNEARISALEATLGETQVVAVEKDDVLAKLAWAVKHGRQRPW